LAGVRGGDLLDPSATPRQLVAEHVLETAPRRIEDTPSKTAVGLDHVADLKPLYHDYAVALGVSVTENVQEVVALASHLAMEASNTELGLLSALRSFLSSRDSALRAGETFEGSLVKAWGRNETSIGVTDEIYDASVERDDRLCTLDEIGDVEFADDAYEPLIAIALQGAGLWLSFERAVENGTEISKFREADHCAFDSPRFRMRLAER
jgi:hypothetical protein